jgi:hypothetical protein
VVSLTKFVEKNQAMRKIIIVIFSIMLGHSTMAQVNIINPTSAGVEILPSGIRGGFAPKVTDSSNIAIGRNALLNNTSSNRNIAIGIDALKLFNAPDNTLNTSIIAIGHGAFAKYNTAGNNLSIAIGKNALGNITQDGSSNIVIGHFSSPNNRGDQKIVIGNRALSSGSTDTDNGTFIGHGVASFAPGGTGNTVIGSDAMAFGGNGNNTILGDGAGRGTSTTSKIGEGNVMLGFRAGGLETGSNKLYIDNSNSLSPLLGGDFTLDRVGINRSISLLGSTKRTLQVEGSVFLTDTLQIPHGSGLGKVLTSDALGNAIWQTPSGGGGLWTQTSGFIENTNPNGFWSRYSSALPVAADNTTNPPVSPGTGNGTRMAWIPSRSAFQGGTFNMADGSVRFVSENIGLFSFCYGLNAESRSRGGIAMGEGAVADGTSNTIAFGESVQVAGTRNFGGGFSNQIADGSSNTILMGENSNATAGQYNHGLGWGLELNGFGTSTFGSFNTLPTGSNTAWVTTDPLFVVGNGPSSLARSNALLIQKNGVVNIGTTPNTSTTYKLRVSGSMSATSSVQAANLRATNLAGTGTRDVCTDDSGNLIVCPGSASTMGIHNVSAMGFQPQTNTAGAAAAFQRDLVNGFVSFLNDTKQTEAFMYAPVELPDGFTLNEMAFHYKQTVAGSMTVTLKKVGKLNAGPALNIISITSASGAGVTEKLGTLGTTEVIDNANNYYFLYLEAGSTWKGTNMALRGVMFYPEKSK